MFEYQEEGVISFMLFSMIYLFDSDIPIILVSTKDGVLSLYNTLNGKVLKKLKSKSQINHFVHDQLGDDLKETCCVALSDGTVVIWDLVDGKELHLLKGHQSSVECLSLNGSSGILVSSSQGIHYY